MQVSSIKNIFNISTNRNNAIREKEQEKDLSVKAGYVKVDPNHIKAKYVAFLGMPVVKDKLTIATDTNEHYVELNEEEIIAADNYTKDNQPEEPKEQVYEASSPGGDLTQRYFNDINGIPLFESKEKEIEEFKKLDIVRDKFVELSNKYESLLFECCKSQGITSEEFNKRLNAKENEELQEDELETEEPQALEEEDDEERGKFDFEEINKKNQDLDKVYNGLNDDTKAAFGDKVKQLRTQLKSANNGYIKQRNTIVEANYKLVPFAVKKYLNQGIDYLDLIEYGNIGLIKAVEKYDVSYAWDNENKFSSYAVKSLERTFERELHNNSKTIRIPVHMRRYAFKLFKVERDFLNEFERRPSNEELVERSGIPLKHVIQYRRLPKTISFELPTSSKSSKSEGEGTLGKVIENTDFSDNGFVNANNAYMKPADQAMLESEESKILHEVYNSVLNERERFILKHRHPADEKDQMFQEEIGIALESAGICKKLTKERVRQIENIALDKVKRAIYRKQQESIRQRVSG